MNNTENNISPTITTTNPDITGSTAKLAEGQSTNTGSFMNGVRTGTLALMTALTPSVSTLSTVGIGLATISCEFLDNNVDPDGIDRTTDNPAARADFMKDVEPVEIRGANGKIGSFSFNAVWNGKNYQLSTVCILNAEGCAEQLRFDAKMLGKEPEQMGMEFYYSNSSGATSIVWVIPYSEFIINSGDINLKDQKFDKYLRNNTVGSSDDLISKKDSGGLRISTGYKYVKPNGSETQSISNTIVNLIPYSFGEGN